MQQNNENEVERMDEVVQSDMEIKNLFISERVTRINIKSE